MSKVCCIHLLGLGIEVVVEHTGLAALEVLADLGPVSNESKRHHQVTIVYFRGCRLLRHNDT